jgi:glycosyltransferase involved in cell wall biosynthesis
MVDTEVSRAHQTSDCPEGRGSLETAAVAVCIPLYQKEAFIAETIRSVLIQSFSDFELIVLDNASTDQSWQIARSFDDPRLTVLRNETTIPPTENFAKVVSLSRAPFVKVLMADDLIHPRCLEKQMDVLLADRRLAMVTCRHDVIDESGLLLAPARAMRTRDLVGAQDRATVLRRVVRHGGNPIGNPGNVLFRRSAFDAAGGFAGEEFFTLDLSTWLRLLRHGDYFGLAESLTSFRISSGSHTTELGGEAIRLQREFIADARRANSELVRGRDIVYGALRAPLTRLRHHAFFAAGGPPNSLRRWAALRLLAPGLGLGSAASGGRARRT